MFSNLEKLYLKRLKFNSKRLKLLEKVRGKGYFSSIGNLVKIRVILQKEIIVNKKIIIVLEKGTIEEEFLEQITLNFKKINSVLVLEEKLISNLSSSQVLLSYFRFVYGRKDSYTEVWNKVKNLSRQEARLNQEIINISSSLPKGFQVDKSKFRKSWQLVLELQRELRKLASSVGNARLVKLHAEKILRIVDLLQKTELYDYMQQDVLWIKKKAIYMTKNPKESKVAYGLATFYIVSPGTFEATGVVLFFRYLGKYTIHHSKKLKSKFNR
jgi:hypothetical protein